MNAKIAGLIACALASTMFCAMTSAPAQAAPAATAYKAPRNGFGQPDLSGTWNNETLTRMERQPTFGDRLVPTPAEVAKIEGERAGIVAAGNAPTNLKAGGVEAYRANCETPATAFAAGCSYNPLFYDGQTQLMRVNGEPRTSLITFPANGRIPRKPGGKSRPDAYAAGNRDNPENRGLPDRCLVSQNISTGALLSPTIYNNTYLFQQSKDTVAIVVEMAHDVRYIRLNAEHGVSPHWLGDSVGHWEGDTLVVDTIHFQPEQLEYNSDQLHLVERFTRVGPDRLLYQFRVEDPVAYTEAWGGEYEFSTAKGPQYEYACHEGNYALHDILSGARADEKAGKYRVETAAAEGE